MIEFSPQGFALSDQGFSPAIRLHPRLCPVSPTSLQSSPLRPESAHRALLSQTRGSALVFPPNASLGSFLCALRVSVVK